MVETRVYQVNKKLMNKLSLYINIIVFFIVALFICLLIVDAYNAGKIVGETVGSAVGGDSLSQAWIYIARDIAFVAIGLTWVFFQFFKNQLLIMRKSW